MPEQPMPKSYLSAAEIAAAPEVHVRHPFNPASDAYLRSLGRFAGLQRVALTLARVPPGRESFIYHSHERDEEFLFILSGRGRAEIDGETIEVGPGDFMGFATPSVAHHLTNPYGEDLVYLMGGEDKPIDVVTYPHLDKRYLLMQTDKGTEFYELGEPTKPFGRDRIQMLEEDGLTPMSFEQWLPEGLPEAYRGSAPKKEA